MHFLRNLTGRLCALGWSVLLLAGCSATLQGPTGAAETRTVQLLEHGRHSSLLLTSSDATRVRYAYGDWAWYVEEDTGVISGGRALLRNSQAGLGGSAWGRRNRAARSPHRSGSASKTSIDSTFRQTRSTH